MGWKPIGRTGWKPVSRGEQTGEEFLQYSIAWQRGVCSALRYELRY